MPNTDTDKLLRDILAELKTANSNLRSLEERINKVNDKVDSISETTERELSDVTCKLQTMSEYLFNIYLRN